MPPGPGRVRDMCAVTPKSFSWRVSRNPLFIASAITSVATPALTPTIENSVTSRSTAGRLGDRRYLRATNHANPMARRPLLPHAVGCVIGNGIGFGAQERKENDIANRMRVRQKHRQAVDSDAFTCGRRHTVAKRPNIVHVH